MSQTRHTTHRNSYSYRRVETCHADGNLKNFAPPDRAECQDCPTPDERGDAGGIGCGSTMVHAPCTMGSTRPDHRPVRSHRTSHDPPHRTLSSLSRLCLSGTQVQVHRTAGAPARSSAPLARSHGCLPASTGGTTQPTRPLLPRTRVPLPAHRPFRRSVDVEQAAPRPSRGHRGSIRERARPPLD